MRPGSPLTVLVPARDAATTISRAMASVRSQHDGPVVLIDHASTDDTARVAAAAACPPLEVVQASADLSVGAVRQLGAERVTTPYAVWLDADDELLPGRTARLLRALEEGADIVADAAELWDGPTTQPLGVMEMPAFLLRPCGAVRLFERNYLPGDAVVGFRTSAVRALGYDGGLHGPEGIDLILRALDRGLAVRLAPEVGYRFHAYPRSLSRARDRQRLMYARCLDKFTERTVARHYAEAEMPRRVTTWALWSMAMFRSDLASASRLLDQLVLDPVAPDAVLEVDGPETRPEGWRLLFARGTVALLTDDVEAALRLLREARDQLITPEGENNLGIAAARSGRAAEARACFAEALRQFPGYADAAENAAVAPPSRITTHPLRARFARSDYRPGPER